MAVDIEMVEGDEFLLDAGENIVDFHKGSDIVRKLATEFERSAVFVFRDARVIVKPNTTHEQLVREYEQITDWRPEDCGDMLTDVVQSQTDCRTLAKHFQETGHDVTVHED